MIFAAAQFFGSERLIAEAAKFFEDRANQLLGRFRRGASVDREHASVGIRIDVAENGVGKALTLANILKQARRHSATENIVEQREREATLVGQAIGRHAEANVRLPEFALTLRDQRRRGMRRRIDWSLGDG